MPLSTVFVSKDAALEVIAGLDGKTKAEGEANEVFCGRDESGRLVIVHLSAFDESAVTTVDL